MTIGISKNGKMLAPKILPITVGKFLWKTVISGNVWHHLATLREPEQRFPATEHALALQQKLS